MFFSLELFNYEFFDFIFINMQLLIGLSQRANGGSSKNGKSISGANMGFILGAFGIFI